MKNPELISVYDNKAFSDTDFQTELDAVTELTSVERKWIDTAGLRPYADDQEILHDVEHSKLARVTEGIGYIARQYLTMWAPDRSNPSHKYHYSPPFVKPKALELLTDIAKKWQVELGNRRFLSVTSLVRSTSYQQNLAKQNRKLTISVDGMVSSHQVGLAFDIDGCGIVEELDDGSRRAINPRSPGFRPLLVTESRLVLRQLLEDRRTDGQINFVEELSGTQEHCFHVCAQP